MKKVRFLQDFQGRETNEVFYKKGQEVELPDSQTQILLADRRVELVDFPQPQTAKEFLEPVVFENVTDVETETADVFKDGGSVEVVEPAKPQAEPKRKRGKK
jgi:hypothetical protein